MVEPTFISCLLIRSFKAQHQVNQAVNDFHKAARHLLAASPWSLGIFGVLRILVDPVLWRLAPFAWIASPRIPRGAASTYKIIAEFAGTHFNHILHALCTG